MFFKYLIFSITVSLVSSQCLVDQPDLVFELRNECSYDKLLSTVNRAKNQLVNNGTTNCLRREEELGALLGLQSTNDMKAKVESICDQALSRSRSDTDFAVDFSTIPLVESEDETTINRFIKEFYDGGTYFNEEIQQTGVSDERNNLNQDTQGIKEFYRTPARRNIVKWPSSQTHNFDQCQYNTVMCCWAQDRQANDDNGNCASPYPNGKLTSSELWTPDSCIDKDPADNTDICYVDMSRSPTSNHVREGAVIYDDRSGVREGDAHCHGFAWADDELSFSHRYRGNNLFYVSFYDHLRARGYVRNVPGAPMCGCVESMPTVSRSDCTEMAITEHFQLDYVPGSKTFHGKVTEARVEFNACEGANGNNNDLEAYYERLVQEDAVRDRIDAVKEYLVGEDNCAPAIQSLLDSYGIVRK